MGRSSALLGMQHPIVHAGGARSEYGAFNPASSSLRKKKKKTGDATSKMSVTSRASVMSAMTVGTFFQMVNRTRLLRNDDLVLQGLNYEAKLVEEAFKDLMYNKSEEDEREKKERRKRADSGDRLRSSRNNPQPDYLQMLNQSIENAEKRDLTDNLA